MSYSIEANNSIPIVSSMYIMPSERRENEEAKTVVKVRKRKSKSEQANRVFLCDFCTKTYLSYPALYTHRKNKHGEHVIIDPKSHKGRPSTKKPEENKAIDPKKDEYFFSGFRCKTKGTSNIELGKCFDEAYKSIFDVKPKKDHKLRERILKVTTEDVAPKNKGSMFETTLTPSKVCDEVFIQYIIHVVFLTNKEFMKEILKFIILYREFFNTKYKSKFNKEYSEVETAEKIPEIANEFYHKVKKEKSMDPQLALELTANMCEWMFQNVFTNYTLLLNNYKKAVAPCDNPIAKE